MNSALIRLLDAISIKTPGLASEWLSRRYCLQAEFKAARYEVRTDDILNSENGRLQAILEVKASTRERFVTKTRMQKAVEMVGRVMDDREWADMALAGDFRRDRDQGKAAPATRRAWGVIVNIFKLHCSGFRGT